jgi:DNA-binding SARP family transcriptional activator
MSSSNLYLTSEEQIIHHHAAVLKKELEAYCACEPRDEKGWRHTFRLILVNSYS